MSSVMGLSTSSGVMPHLNLPISSLMARALGAWPFALAAALPLPSAGAAAKARAKSASRANTRRIGSSVGVARSIAREPAVGYLRADRHAVDRIARQRDRGAGERVGVDGDVELAARHRAVAAGAHRVEELLRHAARDVLAGTELIFFAHGEARHVGGVLQLDDHRRERGDADLHAAVGGERRRA